VRLIGDARRRLCENGLTKEIALDQELATKRLVLVLGAAAGSGPATNSSTGSNASDSFDPWRA
jgi:hypothetical protein